TRTAAEKVRPRQIRRAEVIASSSRPPLSTTCRFLHSRSIYPRRGRLQIHEHRTQRSQYAGHDIAALLNAPGRECLPIMLLDEVAKTPVEFQPYIDLVGRFALGRVLLLHAML